MTYSPIELTWSIVIFMLLLTTSALLFMISIRGFKERNYYGGFSTISCAIITTFFAVYEFAYGLFPWPYGPIFVIVSIVFFLIHFLTRIVKKRKEKMMTVIPGELENIAIKERISLKEEILRKSFHLAGILIPIGYYWVMPILSNVIVQLISGTAQRITLYQFFWGDITLYPYIINDPVAPGELLYFLLWCSVMFMLFFDFFRLFSKPEYTLFKRLLRSVLRVKEYASIGPQVLLVLGALVSFFLAKIGIYSYLIAVSSVLTACLADGLVAVLGRKFGKHKIKMKSGEEKSIEGFIIGFISAYICSMIIIGPIYAIVVAIIFLLLDLFTIPIADNLLNPILLSLGVWGLQVLINIPMGWGL